MIQIHETFKQVYPPPSGITLLTISLCTMIQIYETLKHIAISLLYFVNYHVGRKGKVSTLGNKEKQDCDKDTLPVIWKIIIDNAIHYSLLSISTGVRWNGKNALGKKTVIECNNTFEFEDPIGFNCNGTKHLYNTIILKHIHAQTDR